MPMSMMDGPAGALGRLNADTVLLPGTSQLRKNIYTAVIDFMDTLKKIKGHQTGHKYTRKGLIDTMKDLNIDECSGKYLATELDTMQDRWQHNQTHKAHTAGRPQLPTNWSIQKAKTQLQGYVVSELDKNKAKLYVECPVAHYQRLKEPSTTYRTT